MSVAASGALLHSGRGEGIEVIFEIGKQLQIAHDELANHGDGCFGKWCKERCNFTHATALNYLHVLDVFGSQKTLDLQTLLRTFTAESLYYLSREVTPEDAIKAGFNTSSRVPCFTFTLSGDRFAARGFNPMTKTQIETRLRQNTTKIRAGFRGLSQLMHDKFSGQVPDEMLVVVDAAVSRQIEQAIQQITSAVRGESNGR